MYYNCDYKCAIGNAYVGPKSISVQACDAAPEINKMGGIQLRNARMNDRQLNQLNVKVRAGGRLVLLYVTKNGRRIDKRAINRYWIQLN